MQLDEATTWVDIYAKEKSLVYEYELTYSYDELDISYVKKFFKKMFILDKLKSIAQKVVKIIGILKLNGSIDIFLVMDGL